MKDLNTTSLNKISWYLWTSWQDLCNRSLERSSLQVLFTRPLWEILSLYIQDLLKSLDLLSLLQELSTRSLRKTSMKDLYARAPCKISSYTPGPPRSLHRSSLKDLFPSPIWDISIQDILIPGPPRSLHRGSLQNLFTRPLWEISTQELSTRSQHRTPMRDPYPRALYKISHKAPTKDLHERSLLQERFTRSLHKTSIRQDPYERSLYKISWYLWTSWQDLCERSLGRSPLQDLFTRPPNETLISLGLLGLFTGSLYKIPSQDLMRDLLTRAL